MQKTITTVTDDIDGTPGAETYVISMNGLTVEIDLCKANADKLYNALDAYLHAGRRITGKHARPSPVTADIRAWWKNNPDGLPTWQPRGAVPATVIHAWHTRGTTAPRRRKRAT